MDDVALAALRRRDARAIAAFRKWAIPRLVSTCQRLLRSRGEAEEVAEDVCQDFLIDYLDQVRGAGAVTAYLQMMAVRRCSRLRRRAVARDELRADIAPAEDGDAPYGQSEARLDLRQVERCLERLTPASRRILRLRFGGEQTQEEIGAVMGVSKQYVGRVIQNSLGALKRCMEEPR